MLHVSALFIKPSLNTSTRRKEEVSYLYIETLLVTKACDTLLSFCARRAYLLYTFGTGTGRRVYENTRNMNRPFTTETQNEPPVSV